MNFVYMATVPAQIRHLVDRAVRIAKTERTVTATVYLAGAPQTAKAVVSASGAVRLYASANPPTTDALARTSKTLARNANMTHPASVAVLT